MAHETTSSTRSGKDRLATLSEAVANIRDGQTIAFGGYCQNRHPMALVRELVRQGKRDLHVIAPLGAIDADMALGSGIASKITFGFISMDALGQAPNFRKSVEQGRVECVEFGDVALCRSMEAAQRGLPWMPARVWGGSDIGPFHPGEPLPSDANGGPIWRIPAADIDWALVHVPYSSPRGDLAIGGQAYDVMMVQASRRVIATAERIVPLSELQATWNGRIAPHYDCDFVVECRYGAHPTACYPFYVRDVPHLIEYFETAETDLSAYLQRWLADDEEAYRASHGVDRLLDLERRNAVASLCAAAYAGMSA